MAHREYQAGNYVNAEKHCMTLLQHDQRNISILLLLSSIHFQQKNFDKSMQFSTMAIQVSPDCAEAYRWDQETIIHFHFYSFTPKTPQNLAIWAMPTRSAANWQRH
jgi:hypothetical protein